MGQPNYAPDTQIMLAPVRLSYVSLFEPRGFEGESPKYGTMLLIDKNDTDSVNAIHKALRTAYEKDKSKFANKGQAPTAYEKISLPLRDGDEEHPEDTTYKGHYFMNVNSNSQPALFGKTKSQVVTPNELYSGVYARVQINAYGYNFRGNKGLTFGLNGVQVLGYGDNLEGGGNVRSRFAQYFEEEETTEEADPFFDDLI